MVDRRGLGEASEQYFTGECIGFIASEVAKYIGQEILMGGFLNTAGHVRELTIIARGNDRMVPAIVEVASKYDVVVHNHPSSFLTPSPEDLHAAGVLSDYRVGFYIVTNDGKRVNVVTRSQKIEPKHQLPEEAVLALLKADGRIGRELPSYRYRDHQATMMRGVVHAFNNNEVFICEAPTGTGKSLAYLLPAFLWAKTSRKKVVVATHTILLQEQLLNKDIPLVKRLTGMDDVKVELVKGRQHYLCYRKFKDWFETNADPSFLGQINQEDQDYLDLENWGKETAIGEFRELGVNRYQQEFKEELCCEVDTCKRSLCKHKQDGKCFYGEARKRFSDADILIVNHHILVIDLIIKAKQGRHPAAGLLPAFDYLIVDEAHHLEAVVQSHLGSEATRRGLLKTLSHLASPKEAAEQKNRAPRGTLVNLRNKVFKFYSENSKKNKKGSRESTGLLENETDYALFEEAVKSFIKKFKDLEDIFHKDYKDFLASEEENFLAIYHYLEQLQQQKSYASQRDSQRPPRQQARTGSFQCRIKPSTVTEKNWDRLRVPLANLLATLDPIKVSLEAIAKLLADWDETWIMEMGLEQNINDFKAYFERFKDRVQAFATMLTAPDPEEAKWIATRRTKRGIDVSVHCYQVTAGERIASELLQSMQTVVLTSATLTVEQDFKFFKKRIGYYEMDKEKQARFCECQIQPYFNYKENCGFYIPSRFPNVLDKQFAAYAQSMIAEVVQFLGGRVLILFTSYKAMIEMRNRISEDFKELGVRLLVQGEVDKYAMIEQMKTTTNVVIMGVDSFWEGVDIRGDYLSCLIMMKLPFPNFSDPLIEAQLEYIAYKGGNAFKEFSLPKAILKYRQGFGRLIRGEDERGLFVLLDRRILTQWYGQRFQASLPPLSRLSGEDFTSCAQEFWRGDG